MTQPVKLFVAGQWLNIDGLTKAAIPTNCTEQEKKALELCLDWIQDKEVFEFQTSGSTGTPKEISFSRAALKASARLTEKALHLQQGQTSLICLDPQFIAGAMMVIRSLTTGMNMIVKAPTANPLADVHDPIDFVALVPYQVATMLENPSDLAKAKTIIIGGAPLSPAVATRLKDLPGSIYATYGMTETLTHVALQKLNGGDRQEYFQLLPGIKASTDNRGCLVLTVPHIGTAPILTNDLVSLLGADKFRWLGRADRIINSGAIKIQPEIIERSMETILYGMELNQRFFVTGLPDPKLGESVGLIIEGPPLSSEKESSIRSQLSEKLHPFEVPRSILYVRHFHETDTQKIDRAKTIQLLGQP